MKPRTRLIALSIAVAVNVGALAALHVAMVDAADQRVSLQEPERIVITGSRTMTENAGQELAARNCQNPKAL